MNSDEYHRMLKEEAIRYGSATIQEHAQRRVKVKRVLRIKDISFDNGAPLEVLYALLRALDDRMAVGK